MECMYEASERQNRPISIPHFLYVGVNVVDKKYTSCRNGFDQEFEFASLDLLLLVLTRRNLIFFFFFFSQWEERI